MRGQRLSKFAAVSVVFATVLLARTNAAAQTESVLHSFNSSSSTAAAFPVSSLIFDSAGNLYGTTSGGGSDPNCQNLRGDAIGCGTVFELSPKAGGGWREKVLHNFDENGKDGWYPSANLIFDSAGNLYGTTVNGGTGSCVAYYGGPVVGCGTVFELTPTANGGWTRKILHSFAPTADGYWPYASLIFDGGSLYGTTYAGGTDGGGIVFRLSPKTGGGWVEKILHNFASNAFASADGTYPEASLILNAAGSLYGTTTEMGADGGGTVFELTPTGGGNWTESVPYGFSQNDNGSNGLNPYASLVFGATGNLYGTTANGGAYSRGAVFELIPAAGGGWTETVLYSFNDNGTDGQNPFAGLIFDSAGNLYGTTVYGGAYGSGTVFELMPSASGVWTEKILHSFNLNGTDGAFPQASLILDAAGNLYGTTFEGGTGSCTNGCGTVFEVKP